MKGKQCLPITLPIDLTCGYELATARKKFGGEASIFISLINERDRRSTYYNWVLVTTSYDMRI